MFWLFIIGVLLAVGIYCSIKEANPPRHHSQYNHLQHNQPDYDYDNLSEQETEDDYLQRIEELDEEDYYLQKLKEEQDEEDYYLQNRKED